MVYAIDQNRETDALEILKKSAWLKKKSKKSDSIQNKVAWVDNSTTTTQQRPLKVNSQTKQANPIGFWVKAPDYGVEKKEIDLFKWETWPRELGRDEFKAFIEEWVRRWNSREESYKKLSDAWYTLKAQWFDRLKKMESFNEQLDTRVENIKQQYDEAGGISAPSYKPWMSFLDFLKWDLNQWLQATQVAWQVAGIWSDALVEAWKIALEESFMALPEQTRLKAYRMLEGDKEMINQLANTEKWRMVLEKMWEGAESFGERAKENKELVESLEALGNISEFVWTGAVTRRAWGAVKDVATDALQSKVWRTAIEWVQKVAGDTGQEAWKFVKRQSEKVGLWFEKVWSGTKQVLEQPWETLKAWQAFIKRKAQGAKESATNVVEWAEKKLTRDLPVRVVENRAGLTPTERRKIEDLGEKAWEFLLRKDMATMDKSEQAMKLSEIADNAYNDITVKLKNIDSRHKSDDVKKMLNTMQDEMNKSDIIKSEMWDYIEKLNELQKQADYTPAELLAIRRDFDRIVGKDIFKKSWRVTWEEDKIIAWRRRNVSEMIDDIWKKAWIDISDMNKDLRKSIILREWLLRRLSQEQKNNIFSLQDIWMWAILSAWDPITTAWVVLWKKGLEAIVPYWMQTLYNLTRWKNYVKAGNLSRDVPVRPRDTNRGLSITTGSNVNRLPTEWVEPKWLPLKKPNAVTPDGTVKNPQPIAPQTQKVDNSIRETWLQNVKQPLNRKKIEQQRIEKQKWLERKKRMEEKAKRDLEVKKDFEQAPWWITNEVSKFEVWDISEFWIVEKVWYNGKRPFFKVVWDDRNTLRYEWRVKKQWEETFMDMINKKKEPIKLTKKEKAEQLRMKQEQDLKNKILSEVEETDEIVKLNNRFAKRISAIEAIEQRIWKVWRNKVNDKWFKSKQEAEWIKKKEAVIQDIQQEYGLDQFEAVEKYDDLLNNSTFDEIHYKRKSEAIKNWFVENEEAEKIVRKYFSEDEVSLNFVNNIKTPEWQQAIGKYYKKTIDLINNPAKWVPEHEVAHAYFDLFTDKKTQREILKDIMKKEKIDNMYEAEEFLADWFSEYVANGKTMRWKAKQFVENVREDVKKVFWSWDKSRQLYRDIVAWKRKVENKPNEKWLRFKQELKYEEVSDAFNVESGRKSQSFKKYLKKNGFVWVKNSQWTHNILSDKEIKQFQWLKPKKLETDDDLVALHNITKEKLEKVVELWWLPWPSIGVTKKTIPFEDFGDITLVWNRDLIDPKLNSKNTLYPVDIYSPRVPDSVAFVKKSKEAKKRIKEIAEEVGMSEYEVSEFLEDTHGNYAYILRDNPKLKKYIKERSTLTDKKMFEWFTRDWTRKYSPFNLKNIVKKMFAKWEQWTEWGMFWMSIWSAVWKRAKKISSVESIRKKAKFWMVEKWKYDELNDKFYEATNLLENTKYSSFNWVKDYIDAMSTRNPLETMKEYWYTNLTQSQLDEINSIVDETLNLPKSYIEAKLKRPVLLDEFSAVLVPETQMDEVKKLLSWTWLDKRIVWYSEWSWRTSKLKDIQKKYWNIFFQTAWWLVAAHLASQQFRN